MFKYLIVTMSVLLAGVSAEFIFNKCGGNGDIDVQQLDVRPSVMEFPGEIFIDLQAALKKTVGSVGLKVQLEAKTAFGWVRIPCLMNIGSCNYGDLCTILDRMESGNWIGVGAKLAQNIRRQIENSGIEVCPTQPISASITNRRARLPTIPSILAFLMNGRYRVKVELTEMATDSLMTCVQVELELRKAD